MKISSCPQTSPLAGIILALLGILNLVQPARAQTATVNWTNVYQRIDGFGASSAWFSSWTQTEANMFFGTNSGTGTTLDGKTNFSFNGIGLSFLRNHIIPGGTTGESSIMEKAQALGARVWSTPWSPPGSFKLNIPNSSEPLYGGNFNSADNQAYASQLAAYVVNVQNQYNVNLYAISVQNEPDAAVTTYEACTWTAAQIEQFVPYLYNALAASNVASTKIIVAEDEHWQTSLYGTTMTNATAASDVGIVACHNYDGNNTPAALPLYDNTNAALWETEVSTIGGSFDGSISNAVYWAGRIHLFMTVANANAWHFWWLISENSDNEGLTDKNGYPALRMYALGNFSRFVRPNYYRIGVNNSGSASISAYKSTNSGNFAIVAINSSSSTAVTQTFNLNNFTAPSVTPWITSSTYFLASQNPVTVANSSFTYVLPAQSVVTFVGQSSTTLTASAGPSQMICSGGSGVTIGGSPTASGGAGGYSYSWSPATGLSSATVANPTASPASTTTYTVTVTDSSQTTAQSSITVTINALPTVSVNSPAICAGGSATLTATTSSSSPGYLWSPGGATTASITVSPSSTTAYTVTVTDGTTGCANNGSGTVTVHALPTVGVNSPAVCAGGSATLTATTGASSPSYLWSPGGATTASITVSPSSTTAYTVMVTDGTTGCANSGSGTVTVNALPTVSVNSATVCAGNSATLTATTSANSPSYLWSPGGATTASISLSPSSTTAYTVRVTDGTTGCANIGSGTVTVKPQPTVSVNSATVCAGSSATLTATTGASSPSYLWSPGGATTASNTVSPSSTTTYTVTVTDGTTSCANNGSGTVTVNPLPAITLGASSILAYYGSTNANLPYTATSGSPDGYSITYDSIAQAAGFSNVALTSLPASPITLAVPMTAVGTNAYNGTLALNNSSTGCNSTNYAFTVTVSPLPVTLSIALAGNQVVLFWPAAATNWVLQSTINLLPSAWSNVSPAAVVVNGQNTVTNAISGTQQFYQLSQVATPSNMALIPAGAFTMGDTLDGESDAIPTVTVNVSAFFMDTNLVSYSQWQSVYNWAATNGYALDNAGYGVATNYPVEGVDWYDVVKWCNARSQQAGLTPVYYTDAGLTQVYVNGDTNAVFPNWAVNGCRLPTEAEWEMAARGGLIGQRFPWGNDITENQANYFAGGLPYDLGPYAGFNTNFDGGIPWTDQSTFSGDNSSPVGFFAPNGYGLYDMAGNVWEWCWDWYATPYGQPTANNPTGPAGPLTNRVLRGGNWLNRADNARCAFRCNDYPNDCFVGVGFRCVSGLW